MFNDSLREIVSLYPSENVVLGEDILPKQLIEISESFSKLNLSNEELLLVIFDNTKRTSVVITDVNVFYLVGNQPSQIKINDFSSSKPVAVLSPKQIEIIEKTIKLLLSKKTEHKKTLDSFIEKVKSLVDEDKQNFENASLFFDGRYIEILSHETEEFLSLCNQLNSDDVFIQNVNLIFNGANHALSSYKAEHFLLHDLIKAYNSVLTTSNEKSTFTLAYFFERLNGNNSFKGISVQRLNEMTTKTNFNANIEKIKNSKIVTLDDKYSDEYILPAILYRMNHLLFHKAGNLIYRFGSIVAKADNKISEDEKRALKKILEKTTHPTTSAESDKLKTQVPEDDTFEAVMAELNSLTGLEEVKKSIAELINFLKIQKIRDEKGLENIQTSLHAVFLGPPGTGKTTVARLLGRIYKHLGFLQKGHVIETDRAGMVAGFVGQTAQKVEEIVFNSMDGVLFIDEAYSLLVENGERDFGHEAIDILVKRMEDNRKNLVVVVAGYTEPMKMFIESNPGLRSRFNRYFVFQHFLPQQMLEIMKTYCQKADFVLTQEANDKLLDTFEMLYEKRDDSFGNARVVRNIFERSIQNQANRLVTVPELTKKLLQTIEANDIPEPKDTVDLVYLTKEN